MKKGYALSAYKKTRKIDGWFSLESALLLALFDEFQMLQNIKGDIFEIGVHHGKSAVFFGHLLDGCENLNVCDIFDSQHSNLSKSGRGNQDIFLKNMETLSPKGVNQVHPCLSSDIELDKLGAGYRMFHIDGGHNKDEALFDLTLAAKSILDNGLIILDDPFKPEWPGVTEALIEFLDTHKEFEAIAVGFDKIYIVKKEFSLAYIEYLDSSENRSRFNLGYPYSFKQLPFAKSQLKIFFIPSYLKRKPIKVLLVKKIRSLLWKG